MLELYVVILEDLLSKAEVHMVVPVSGPPPHVRVEPPIPDPLRQLVPKLVPRPLQSLPARVVDDGLRICNHIAAYDIIIDVWEVVGVLGEHHEACGEAFGEVDRSARPSGPADAALPFWLWLLADRDRGVKGCFGGDWPPGAVVW